MLWAPFPFKEGAGMRELVEHTEGINRLMARFGVKFGIYKNGEFHEQLFPFDAIPRVITREEFRILEKGLIQRADALNLFLKDIYGEKKIIKDQVVPEEFVFISSGYLPECEGICPPKGIYSHISGIDLVLGKDGEWYILEDNPDSVVSNMKRAYDNAVVLREELSSNVLSYVQLALDTFQACKKTTAPLLELQQAIDYLLAFWGCADDYVDQEDCRNILKCGKYVERLDLFIRLDYHREDLEKEFRKLTNRLFRTNLNYNEENLKRLEQIIMDKDHQKSYDQEALGCLGGLIS